jgi:hypothetical protein
VSDNVRLESGDSFLVTDSAFTNRVYLIVEERKGAHNPKGGVALAQLNKAEVGELIERLETQRRGMT